MTAAAVTPGGGAAAGRSLYALTIRVLIVLGQHLLPPPTLGRGTSGGSPMRGEQRPAAELPQPHGQGQAMSFTMSS